MPQKPQTPRRKAINTLSQGLAVTLASALVVSLLAAFTSATSWAELGGALVAFSFVQSIVVAGLTYLMRGFVDRWRAELDNIELAHLDDDGEG